MRLWQAVAVQEIIKFTIPVEMQLSVVAASVKPSSCELVFTYLVRVGVSYQCY